MSSSVVKNLLVLGSAVLTKPVAVRKTTLKELSSTRLSTVVLTWQQQRHSSGSSSSSSNVELSISNFQDHERGHDISFLRDQLKKIVGSSKAFADGFANREKLLELLPKSQEELPSKSIKDGLQVAWLKLSDEAVREKYVNFLSNVRLGRILEDLDTFAVWTSFMHNNSGTDIQSFQSPLVIVTAMVDQIDMKQTEIKADRDLRMLGYVSWVGSTSMEITMNLQQQPQAVLPSEEIAASPFETVLSARFLMVARDPLNRGSAFVAPLKLEGPDEEAIFAAGIKHKALRQKSSKESLLKTCPSPEETSLIHSMFLETLDAKQNTFRNRVKPPNSVWMDQTMLKNVLINHPQERNLYNKIFGGHLMRQAFELAWSNAVRYARQRINAISIDDIIFQRPVEIGTLLFLSSQVVFTQGKHIQIRVHAEVLKPTDAGGGETSNVFYFTFGTVDGADVPVVMPKTYAEYMTFVDGKRHFEAVMDHNGHG